MNRPLTFLLIVFILIVGAKLEATAQLCIPDKKTGVLVKSVEAKAGDLQEPRILVDGNLWIYVEGPILFSRPNGSTTRANLEAIKPGMRIRAYGAGEATRGFHANKILILLEK